MIWWSSRTTTLIFSSVWIFFLSQRSFVCQLQLRSLWISILQSIFKSNWTLKASRLWLKRLILQSHQTFHMILTLKLLRIMLRNRCWPTTFHIITTGQEMTMDGVRTWRSDQSSGSWVAESFFRTSTTDWVTTELICSARDVLDWV